MLLTNNRKLPMSQNNVTYTVALTPENATKIDAINKILLGEDYTATTPAAKTPKSTPTSKPKAEKEDSSSDVTFAQLKKAAQEAKKEHGQEFVVEVIEAAGGEGASLAKKLSSLEEDVYATVVEAFEEGPEESLDDAQDDLNDDDGLDEEAEIDAETVQKALRALAKEGERDEAKRIMTDNGCKTLAEVKKASVKQLTAMMKELA